MLDYYLKFNLESGVLMGGAIFVLSIPVTKL